MTVTFTGHSKLNGSDPVKQWLENTVEQLIQRGAVDFLLGGYGEFDHLSAKVVNSMKKDYPNITSYLVIPSLDRNFNNKLYTDSIFPPLENVPPRFALSKRNQWMMDEADVVVAYVLHSWGGAATSLEYAIKKKREIILYKKRDSFAEN